jgi:hypothetical protein
MALRKPGLKNGMIRRREVYEDRSARISILAGRRDRCARGERAVSVSTGSQRRQFGEPDASFGSLKATRAANNAFCSSSFICSITLTLKIAAPNR